MEVINQLLRSLPNGAENAIKVALWLIILFAVFAPLEKLFPLRKQKTFRPHWAIDTGYYFINSLLPKVILIVVLSKVLAIIGQYGPTSFYQYVASLPFEFRFPAAIIVGEIGGYWGHRLMHEMPGLWRFHAVHHSAEELDWIVNTRAHPIDILITRAFGLIPLYLLGLVQPTGLADPVVTAYALFGTLWSFVVHANVKWRFGALESLIATPAFHHWHHTKDGPELINKNYAAILPFVDRLFGTLYLPKDQWPKKYGIDSHKVANGLIGQLIQPFKR
jgi:sterol desaturase/sphingolipid hydroxylase (fatty acid hydroxylase superfamily)